MSKTDAEYMRAYRARRKAEAAELAHLEAEHRDGQRGDHIHETARWLDGPLSFAVARCLGCGWQGETYETSLPKRIAELEAEVKHLKAELAKRVTPIIEPVPYERGKLYPQPGFNSRPFTPAPKKGK